MKKKNYSFACDYCGSIYNFIEEDLVDGEPIDYCPVCLNNYYSSLVPCIICGEPTNGYYNMCQIRNPICSECKEWISAEFDVFVAELKDIVEKRNNLTKKQSEEIVKNTIYETLEEERRFK